MHVLQLGPFPPPHGGVQTNLVGIRDRLRSQGHRCSVINLTGSRRPNADGVFYPDSALDVLRLLFTLDCDVVHFHLGGNIFVRLSALALLCALKPGAKSILTFHSGGFANSSEGKSATRWGFRGFVFRRFDRIVAVNLAIVEVFRRFGVSADRIRLIPPYASTSPPADQTLPAHLEKFFAAHDPVLLTVGLLEPEYDLLLQIEAVDDLRKRLPNAGLVIVGSGSLQATLQSTIASSPSGGHVLLYGDMLHNVTLSAIARCGVFLRTTLYDGDSIAVREALDLGAPVIATDNGMRPGGVLLVPVGDRPALCAAIERCVAAPRRQAPPPAEDGHPVQRILDLYAEVCRTAS